MDDFFRWRGPLAGMALALCLIQPVSAVYFSKPEFASASSGLLRVDDRGSIYRGSATVARDERLLYTCAHMFYDRGRWANDYVFHRAWHSQKFPAKRVGVAPRGFHYFTAYERAARFTSGESNASFANDFVVMYGNSSFGPAMEVWENSGPALRATNMKRIIGYPANIDYTGRRGYSYQHSTGWFPNRAMRIRGAFHNFRGVSTGTGNSGGGIHVRDGATGQEYFAGVLVSGSYGTAGVVAMNSSTRSLSDDALGSAGTAWSSVNANRIVLDDARLSVSRTLPVDVKGSVDGGVTLKLEFGGAGETEPRVWLQSPSGRTRRVAVDGTSDGFDGVSSSGAWRVLVRAGEGSPVAFTRVTLSGTAKGAEE